MSRQPQDEPLVLVTGAAGNLGFAVCQAFAALGASVAMADQDQQRLWEARTRLHLPEERCAALAADVTSLPACEALAGEVLRRFGRVDVLVNVAGGFRMGAVHETSPMDFDLLMGLNLRSVYHLARAVVPCMVQQRRGVIINVASRAALQGGAGSGVYAASKAAVLRLTESMAAELMDQGVRVNAVLPSTLDTPENRRAMPGEDAGRFVQPASVAGVICFLASDVARDISGAAIPVYGRC